MGGKISLREGPFFRLWRFCSSTQIYIHQRAHAQMMECSDMNLESSSLVERRAFTLNGFCEAYGISRAMFYKLLKAGQAPRFAKIGSKILIATDAAAEWLRSREVA
jgi:predicted DNA-binding transcriptional regulator AlpA